MSGKLPSLRKRLAKVEQKLVGIANAAESVDCNCRLVTFADLEHLEEFEAEMNRTCPAHGFLRLGIVVHAIMIGEEENPRLGHLLEIYEKRRLVENLRHSKLREVGLKLKHGFRES